MSEEAPDDSASAEPAPAQSPLPEPKRRRPLVAERELRIGWPGAALGAWVVLHYVLAVAPYLWVVAQPSAPMEEQPLFAWLPALMFAPSSTITLLLALAVLIRIPRVAPGTRGRARMLFLALGATLRALGAIALVPLLMKVFSEPNAFLSGLGGGALPVGGTPEQLESIRMVASSQGTLPLLLAALIVTNVGALVEQIAAVSAWFLIPQRVRRGFWLVTDVLVGAAFVAVLLLLPWKPLSEAPDAWQLPAIKLAVTTVASVRILARVLPFGLDGMETVGIRLLVAARMMRAKKSGFVTAIGFLSIGAVSISSCVLTSTLSVMGGFRNDLKQKILGNHAHVVVDQEHGEFEGWAPTLDAVRATDGVVAASPYVQGEVMITSATNLAGAVIRGIDPATISDVTELRRNLRHGQLDYLEHPERLNELRASEMRRGLLAPPEPGRIEIDDGPTENDRGSLFDEVERTLDEVDREQVERERIEADIDEFLLPEGALPERPSRETAAPGDAPEDGLGPDVLPGLIVGQELARTLRLHVGDEVNVVSPLGELGPSGPMPKSRPFRVAGIFYSGMYEFDVKMAYTTLEAAQGFLSVGDAITGIEAKVEDAEAAMGVAAAMERAIGRDDLRVRAWQEVNKNLFGALRLEKLVMFIMLGIAILVASFCIVATLTLLVQEKRKEVGILKAMGATAEQIVAIFMAQGLMIGVLGAATGLGLGYVATFATEHFGINLNPDVYYIDRLPVHVDPAEFALTGVATVIVCLLATIYPAILGSRLQPMEALRDT
ncbi:MAG: ABC transporter permease [Sandaracinaceae bacterium]